MFDQKIQSSITPDVILSKLSSSISLVVYDDRVDVQIGLRNTHFFIFLLDLLFSWDISLLDYCTDANGLRVKIKFV